MYIVQAGPAAEGVASMDIDALIDDATPAFVQAVSADSSNRERGVTRILSDTTLSEEDTASAKEILQRRLADNDVVVVKAIYSQPKHLSRFLDRSAIFKIVRTAVRHPELHRDVVLAHVEFFCDRPAQDTVSLDEIFCDILFPFLFYTKSKRVTVASVWKAVLASSLVESASGIFAGIKEAHGAVSLDEDVAAAAVKDTAIAKAFARKSSFAVSAFAQRLRLHYLLRQHRGLRTSADV